MNLRAGMSRAAAMLAAGLLGALAAQAQSAPPVTRDSSVAASEARPDPAILWTFDTGG